MIGKTVELEFRLATDKPKNDETIAQRKLLAENLRTEAAKNPDAILSGNQNKGGESIYANLLHGTLDQLPTIYQNNEALLNAIATGEVSHVISGVYQSATISGVQIANADVEGFTFFRVLSRNTASKTYIIQDVFVRNYQEWLVAQGNDGAILNGAYFTLAQATVNEI